MNPIEELLCEVNRLFEEEVQYFPADGTEPLTLKATRELISISSNYGQSQETWKHRLPARVRVDSVFYMGDTPQTFRMICLSFDRDKFARGDGTAITPRRGDTLRAKSGLYRLIEMGGVPFVERFEAGFNHRILTFWERESD
ncbi:MAG: hypothetical protein K6E55_10670 [Thermoguttaceae bacterium]|nr:hypothetical protein [Thermoguttaceae bacterium]